MTGKTSHTVAEPPSSHIRADEIVFRRRRFGPAALRQSAHARALWSMKMVPCCTEHWQYLVDACPCDAIQRWQSADRLDRCDACNMHLGDAEARNVAPELQGGLGFLIGLLDPDEGKRAAARQQLPESLAHWDGGLVFELALAVMPLTEEGYVPDRGHEPPAADLPHYATSLAQAADVVRAWPDGLVAALTSRVMDRAVSKRNARYRGLGGHLAGLDSDMLPSLVRAAIAEALGLVSAEPGSVPIGQIGMREAALLTGQEEAKLAAARRLGQLRTTICLRANRLFPALDRAEVEWLNDFLENRIGPMLAAQRLHLPQYAMAQLAEEGLLTFADHPYVVAHYDNLQLHGSELERLQNELLRGAVPAGAINGPVPFHRVARGIGGGMKPWGAMIAKLLDGRIAYSCTGGSMDRIAISGRDAASLRLDNLATYQPPSPPRHVSQSEALEILNLPLKHAHILPGVKTVGGAHRIPWKHVRRLAQTRITLAELSARTGIHGTSLENRLEKEGCLRHDEFGWVRRDALAKIVRY